MRKKDLGKLAFPDTIPKLTRKQKVDELLTALQHADANSRTGMSSEKGKLNGILSVHKSDFDSETLGVVSGSVDRLLLVNRRSENGKSDLDRLLRIGDNLCRDLDLQFVSTRVQSGMLSPVIFEKHKWQRIEELNVYRSVNRDDVESPAIMNSQLRGFRMVPPRTQIEWRQLADFASRSFVLSRFSRDKKMPELASKNVYRRWILGAIDDESSKALVIWKEDDIAGMILAKLKRRVIGPSESVTYGSIDLVAVDRKFSNLGLGRVLMGRIADWLRRYTKEIYVGTQADNNAAIRTYLHCGFTPYTVLETYHKWI